MGKSSPTPPQAPNPIAIAGAQGEANIESAIASAILNQQNVVGPEGTVSFAQTGGQNVGGQFVPSFTRTTQLTPEAQAQFEAQQQLGGALTGLAQGQVGRIEGALGQGIDTSGLPGLAGGAQGGAITGGIDTSGLQQVRQDFGQQGQELEQATFQRGLNLLRPELARQRGDVERLVSERGLPIGSEAAQNRLFSPFEERRNQALENLALSSVGAGRQEQARLFQQGSQQRGQQFGEQSAGAQFANQAQNLGFNQALASGQAANAARAQGFQEQAFQRSIPINDIAALLGTAPGVQAPQFQATPAFGVQAPDVIGASLGAANIAQQQFAQQQQQSSGLLGGLFNLGGSLGSAAILSDRRLKANVRKIGKTSKGFNLYSYIKNGIEEIGVMAQEVMQTLPEAVVIKDGYYAVIYNEVT